MDTPGATFDETGFPAGWHVGRVEVTGSTNTDLLEAAAAGAPDRSVLSTGHQTAGRGRLDRKWDAPPGTNLLVSILFRSVPAHPHELTQRVGVAAVAAVRAVAGVGAVLKWPNDMLLDGRKLSGMLAQAAGVGPTGGPDHVVVGIGINVRWAPEGAARLGEQYDPMDVLRELLAALDGQPADIRPLYRAALATLGSSVRVELPAGELHGTAIDVEPDGRLVVLDECGISHRVDTGDVVHLR